MKKSAQGIVRRTRGRDTLQFGADILQGDVAITRLLNGDLSFGINGSASTGSGQAPDKITVQMRRRAHAEIINGGKAANDETAYAWRGAA